MTGLLYATGSEVDRYAHLPDADAGFSFAYTACGRTGGWAGGFDGVDRQDAGGGDGG